MLPVPLVQKLLVTAIVAPGPCVSKTVSDREAVQLFASVAVTLYVPAANPVAVALFKPALWLQEYVTGAVPPCGATVAVPLLWLHNSLVVPTEFSDSAGILETVAEAVRNGISGYIIKPFNAKKVLDTIQGVAVKVRASRSAKNADPSPSSAP